MNTRMTSVKLDWSTADVEDADLTVALEGDISKAWKDRFENTARLLGHGNWGDVRLRKGKVRVSDVAPGGEEKLRHHLRRSSRRLTPASRARRMPAHRWTTTPEPTSSGIRDQMRR